MTITITGTTYGNKSYTLSATSVSKLASTWTSTRKTNYVNKGIIIPDIINVITDGDLLLITPSWTYANNILYPGSGGFESNLAGTQRLYKITVTSDEYPVSIINNNYVCLLSKKEFTPTIASDNKGIYLAKIGVEIDSSAEDGFNTLYDIYHGASPDDTNVRLQYYSAFTVAYEFIKLSDVYEDNLFTIATMCNSLANINQTYTFNIKSKTELIFYWAINSDTEFIPFIYTPEAQFKGVFTPEYFSYDIKYYTQTLANWYNCYEQTIQFIKPSSNSVSITSRDTRSGMNLQTTTITFTPTTTPANITSDDYNITKYPEDNSYEDHDTSNSTEILKCPKDDIWPETSAGSTVSSGCNSNISQIADGVQTRTCNDNGVWEDVIDHCVYHISNKTETSSNNNTLTIIIILVIIGIIVIIIIIFVGKKNAQNIDVSTAFFE